ncbi:MAG: bifunctional metallophosphatase/5'-nucleotidase [Muribaculaceae bacterium]|nr:bifunctional metallophosphatase/5'-nucleotidase [Muribaculaceae bacterium]
MKKLLLKAKLLITLIAMAGAAGLCAQNLVILHTNDTHSHIDAENGVGGVLQRKALIDSVRNAEKNVVVVDAGDIVQGSLYFKLFGGQVEYPLMDMMGYDIQILGNHEFDNGIESLAKYYKRGGAAKLSANYDFSNTPLKGVFDPYIIKKIGGKKVGFFGLNLKPEGIISTANYKGLVYNDIIESANKTAAELKAKGCELVVAVSHIGYSDNSENPQTTDVDVARASKDIDIIISGHSHELVSPQTADVRPNIIMNANGKPVLIEQTGRYGANLGYIKIDLSNTPTVKEAKMIPVAGVNPAKFDKKIAGFIAPFRAKVDSINARQIAVCDVNMLNTKVYTSSAPLSNMAADIVYEYANQVADSLNYHPIDLALINSGGIRMPMDAGVITEGQILSTFPFVNYVEIVEMPGSVLSEVLTQAALQKGQAVSFGVWIGLDSEGQKVESILIDGQTIEPERTYSVATLDYLAGGGDYLSDFKKATSVWRDSKELCAPVMQYIVNMGKAGIPINPDPRPRIVTVKRF